MADYSYMGDDTGGDPYLDWIRSLQKRDQEKQAAESADEEEKPGMLARFLGKDANAYSKAAHAVRNSGGTVNPIFTSEPTTRNPV